MLFLEDYCLAFYCVCIFCRPSTVKSCNIFAKIFIHQPSLRHCRVNEQQLRAHSKWILPARYPTWEFLLFSFFFLSKAFTCSAGDFEYESITSSTQQLVWKWAILFHSENNSTFLGNRKKREIVSLIVSGENIIWERKPCYWTHYHIHNRASEGKAMLIKAVQEAYS